MPILQEIFLLSCHWLWKPIEHQNIIKKTVEQPFVSPRFHAQNCRYFDYSIYAACHLWVICLIPREAFKVPRKQHEVINARSPCRGSNKHMFVSITFGGSRCAIPRCLSFQLRFWSGSLEKLQRRRERLEGLLARIQRPRLESFEVDGKRYQLPLLAKDAEIEHCSEDRLAYLAGFFDGDGCVSLNKTTGSFSLVISQSVKGAEALMRFRQHFGGSINRKEDGNGFTTPSLRWWLCGEAMKRASALLTKHSRTKRSQLQISARGHVKKASRLQVADELKLLKRGDYVPDNRQLLWQYIAGFFDAEGCIRVFPNSVSIVLQLSQVKPAILLQIRSFLHREQHQSCQLYTNKSNKYLSSYESASYQISCCGNEECKRILQELLANGLQQKREHANLARDLTSQNHVEIRDALFQLTGQQSRYKRLDSVGVDVAKQIQQVRSRLRRSTVQANRATLEEELSSLLQKRQIQQLQSSCELMCSDLRRLLKLGASIGPWQVEKQIPRFPMEFSLYSTIEGCFFVSVYVSRPFRDPMMFQEFSGLAPWYQVIDVDRLFGNSMLWTQSPDLVSWWDSMRFSRCMSVHCRRLTWIGTTFWRTHWILQNLSPDLEHVLLTKNTSLQHTSYYIYILYMYIYDYHVCYFLAGMWDLFSIHHADPQIVRPWMLLSASCRLEPSEVVGCQSGCHASCNL